MAYENEKTSKAIFHCFDQLRVLMQGLNAAPPPTTITIPRNDVWTLSAMHDRVASFLSKPNNDSLASQIASVSINYPDIFLNDDDQALVGSMIAEWHNNPISKGYPKVSHGRQAALPLLDELFEAKAHKLTLPYPRRSKILSKKYCLLKKVLCGEVVNLRHSKFTPTLYDGMTVEPKLPTNSIAVYSDRAGTPQFPMQPKKLGRAPVMTVAYTPRGAIMFVAANAADQGGLEISVKAVGHDLGDLRCTLTNTELQSLLLGKKSAERSKMFA